MRVPKIVRAPCVVFAVSIILAAAVMNTVTADLNSPVFNVHDEFDVTPELGPGIFLVASRGLTNRHFSETVVLLIEHDETGSLGLIINRPSDFPLTDILPDFELLNSRPDRLHVGGPVQLELITVLFRSEVPLASSEFVAADIFVSASDKLLRQLLKLKNQSFVVFAGYAGWGPGQLENELRHADWRTARVDSEFVFDRATEDIWPSLVGRTGVFWTKAKDDGSPQRALVALRSRSE